MGFGVSRNWAIGLLSKADIVLKPRNLTSPHRNSRTDRRGRRSANCVAPPIAKSARPKTVQRLRRSGLGVLKFCRGQTRCKCGKHRASGFLYIDGGVAMHAIMNTLQKGASIIGHQVRVWMPSLVVETAQQRWQLRSDVYGLIPREAVAQRVQCRQQNQIGPLAVMPAKAVRDVIDPGLCLRYGGVEITNFLA